MKELSFQEKINNFRCSYLVNQNKIKEYMTENEVIEAFHNLDFNYMLDGFTLCDGFQLITFHKCEIYKQTKNHKWVNGGFDNIKFEDMGLVEVVDGYKLEIKEI